LKREDEKLDLNSKKKEEEEKQKSNLESRKGNQLNTQFHNYSQFKFLIQDIINLLDLEKQSTEQEHPDELEETFVNYGLDKTNVRFVKNLPAVLQFTKYLVNYLNLKYGKFPIGYEYFKDTAKRIEGYSKDLEIFAK